MVVDSVVVEGRSLRVTAQRYGVSKSWVAELVHRYREGGAEALVPKSKAPKTNPRSVSPALEEVIVSTRKELENLGADAGAETIHWHMANAGHHPPSVATVYRVLKRRGFIVPEPRKRPRLVHPLRGVAAQRVLADRYDPLATWRWHRRRDPHLHRRLLEAGTRV